MKSVSNLREKTLHYQTDGTGRDTYIKINEGGLTKQNNLSTNLIVRHTTWQSPRKIDEQKLFGPQIKSLAYYGDGTGRDTYIISNYGGNTQVFSEKNKSDVAFKGQLRNYNQAVYKVPRYLKPHEIVKQSIQFNEQQEKLKFLSTPRFINKLKTYSSQTKLPQLFSGQSEENI